MISLPPRTPELQDFTTDTMESVREAEERLRPRKVAEIRIGDYCLDVLADPLMAPGEWGLRRS